MRVAAAWRQYRPHPYGSAHHGVAARRNSGVSGVASISGAYHGGGAAPRRSAWRMAIGGVKIIALAKLSVGGIGLARLAPAPAQRTAWLRCAWHRGVGGSIIKRRRAKPSGAIWRRSTCGGSGGIWAAAQLGGAAIAAAAAAWRRGGNGGGGYKHALSIAWRIWLKTSSARNQRRRGKRSGAPGYHRITAAAARQTASARQRRGARRNGISSACGAARAYSGIASSAGGGISGNIDNARQWHAPTGGIGGEKRSRQRRKTAKAVISAAAKINGSRMRRRVMARGTLASAARMAASRRHQANGVRRNQRNGVMARRRTW